ncbi:MAG: CaiB/BaiF CoA-transferase family protein, partial [Myxococcota bacterium]
MSNGHRQGPLAGLRIVEFTGLGPGPFAAMMLSDLGAEIIRIDRPNSDSIMPQSPYDFMSRGRRRVELNLKDPAGLEQARALIARADALIEGFRPGVMEKLQLGPEACLEANPRLVYGRMTGWGQEGPLAPTAGHDLNYLALSGALHAMGEPGRPPTPPLNLIADFGGGGQLLAFGIVSALLSARTTGQGQVVDAAMVDGCATLMTAMYGMLRMGLWQDERGVNILDGSAPFYACYTCKDDKYIAVAAIEPQFYALLLQKLGIEDPKAWPQFPPSEWPAIKAKFAELFKTRSRDQWCALFEGSDACVAPVLSMTEAPEHPHNQARNT